MILLLVIDTQGHNANERKITVTIGDKSWFGRENGLSSEYCDNLDLVVSNINGRFKITFFSPEMSVLGYS